MKKERFVKSNKQQYFLYFLSLSLIILIFISMFYYFYFSTVMRNNAKQAGRNTISLLENSQNFIIGEIEKVFINLALNPTLSREIGDADNPDIQYVMELDDLLKNTIASRDYIHSISIYYYATDTVMSTQQGLIKTEVFYDEAYLQDMLEKGITRNFFDIRTISDSSSPTGETTVLTFVGSIPISSVKHDMLFIINVKYDSLEMGLNSISEDDKSGMVILNAENKPIFQSGVGERLTEQQAQALTTVSEIRVGGSQVLVSTEFSEKYQWTFCYLTQIKGIFSDIWFVITFLLLFILLGICLFFLSNRMSLLIYRPIKKIFMQFNPPKGDGAVNEVQVIQDNVEKTIKKNKSLESLLSEYQIYQRNMYLKSLVEDSAQGDYQSLEFYDIHLQLDGYFMVYVVSMDNYREFLAKYSAQQQNMFLMYQREMVSDFISENHRGFLVNIDNESMLVVLNLPKELNGQAAREQGSQISMALKKLLNEDEKHTFTIGVSMLHQGIASVSKCYHEALDALNYRFIFGLNTVILYESIAPEQSEIEYPVALENGIIKALKAGSREAVGSALEQFIQYFRDNLPEDVELVRTCVIQLYSASFKAFGHFLTGSVPFNEVYKTLMGCLTIDDMAQELKNFYGQILDASDEKVHSKNRELLEQTKQYIDSHLGDNLQMERIAEHFYISASYLRKLFKEGTGETIKEYVDARRMEEAKRLLCTTDKKVGDIAQAVGYLSIQSFTTAFKANTGMTPAKYRSHAADRGNSKSE